MLNDIERQQDLEQRYRPFDLSYGVDDLPQI